MQPITPEKAKDIPLLFSSSVVAWLPQAQPLTGSRVTENLSMTRTSVLAQLLRYLKATKNYAYGRKEGVDLRAGPALWVERDRR